MPSPEGALDAASPEGALDAQSPEGALDAASPEGALDATSPEGVQDVTQVEAPAAYIDQRIADNVSETEANSHYTAFETWVSEQPLNRGSTGSGETDLREVVGEAMTNTRLAKSDSRGRELPAYSREAPEGRTTTRRRLR